MNHTQIVYTLDRDGFGHVDLPGSVRRVVASANNTLTNLHLVADIARQSRNLGFSTYDSGESNFGSCALYYNGTRGTVITIEVYYVSTSLDTGQPQSLTIHPLPGSIPLQTDLAGEWPIAPTRKCWDNLGEWSFDRPITAILGNEANKECPAITPILKTIGWHSGNNSIPSSATITGIAVNLLANARTVSGSNDVRVRLSRASLIQLGKTLDYDFCKRNHSPVILSNSTLPQRETLYPLDDPLWGASWSVASINTGLNQSSNPATNVIRLVPGKAPTNEIQYVHHSGTGGTFTLTFAGQTTSNIAWNATAGTVQTALEALSNVAAGDVSITKTSGGGWYIEFIQNYAATTVPLLTGNGTNLTGAASAKTYTSTRPISRPDGSDNHISGFILARPDRRDARLNFAFTDVATNTRVAATSAGTVDDYFPSDLKPNERRPNNTVHEHLATITSLPMGSFAAWNELKSHSDYNHPLTVLRVEFIGPYAGKDIRATDPYFSDVQFDPLDLTTINSTEPVVFQDHLFNTFPTTIPGTSSTEGTIQVGGGTGGTTQNKTVTLSLIGNPTGGTFTITFQGQTTSGIAYNASASTIQTALEALSNVTAGDVTVTEIGHNTFTIEFEQNYGGTDVELISVNTASLTGGGISATKTQIADPGRNEQQLVAISGGNSNGEWGLSWDPGTGYEYSSTLAKSATAAQLKTAITNMASVASTDLNVLGNTGGPYLVEFIDTYELSPRNLMRPLFSIASGFGLALAFEIENMEQVSGRVLLELHSASITVFYNP